VASISLCSSLSSLPHSKASFLQSKHFLYISLTTSKCEQPIYLLHINERPLSRSHELLRRLLRIQYLSKLQLQGIRRIWRVRQLLSSNKLEQRVLWYATQASVVSP
jgi:hypothetical protein